MLILSQNISQSLIFFKHLLCTLVTRFHIINDEIQPHLWKCWKNIYTVENHHKEFVFSYLETFALEVFYGSIYSSHHLFETFDDVFLFIPSLISHRFFYSSLVQITSLYPSYICDRQHKAFLLLKNCFLFQSIHDLIQLILLQKQLLTNIADFFISM